MSKDSKLPGWFRGMLRGASDYKAEQAKKAPPPPPPPKDGKKK